MTELPLPPPLPVPDLAERLLDLAASVLEVGRIDGRGTPAIDEGPPLARAAAAAPGWGMAALGTADLPGDLLPWLQVGRVAVADSTTGPVAVALVRLGVVRVWREGRRQDLSTVAFLGGRVAGVQSRWLLFEVAEPRALLAAMPGAPATPWRRLFHLLRAEREDVTLVVVYGAAAGLLALAVPLMAQVLTNTIAFGAFQQPVLALAFGLFLCLAVAACLRAAQHFAVELLERRLLVRTADDISRRLDRVKLEKLDEYHGPELVNRFFDVFNAQKALGVLLLDGVAAALQGLAGLVLLGLYHPALLSFDLVLIALAVGLLFAPVRRGQQTAIEESNSKYALASWLQEVARTPGVHRLGGAALNRPRTAALSRRWLAARADHFRVHFAQFGGALALQAAASAVLLGLGGWLVVAGQLSLGQLVAAELVVASLLAALAKFAEKLESVYDLLAALDKVGKLVDLPMAPLGSEEGLAPEKAARLDLRAVQVDAAGASWTMSLGAGQRGALVVRDPDARRRLAEAVCGLRAPASGWLAYDGMHLGMNSPSTSDEGVMLLRAEDLVGGTLRDNLTLGRLDRAPREVEEALRAVGVLDRARPLDLDAELRPGGRPVSAGLAARLLAARAILGRPRLLVVDALLDDLDDTDREAVRAALEGLGGRSTVLVLTGDLAVASSVRSDSTPGAGSGGAA